MADGTKIEWADATWQIVTGCSIVSPGCTNCYAMRLAGARLREHPSRKGLTKVVNGKPVWTGEVRFNEQWLKQPLEWKKPRRIFVAAHGDLFHENVPDDWIDRVFAVMALAPWHTFQVLTKRAKRMREYCTSNATMARLIPLIADDARCTKVEATSASDSLDGFSFPHIWLGVTAEDQPRADERIPDLLATPAAKRFVSVEPMSGQVDLGLAQCTCPWPSDAKATRHLLGCPSDRRPHRIWSVDWVICGGESGHDARPMNPDWARLLRDQCEAAGVPFFFKQWGEWFPRSQWEHNPELLLPEDDYAFNSNSSCICRFEDRIDGMEVMHRVGKRRAGRLLDGKEHNEFPR